MYSPLPHDIQYSSNGVEAGFDMVPFAVDGGHVDVLKTGAAAWRRMTGKYPLSLLLTI